MPASAASSRWADSNTSVPLATSASSAAAATVPASAGPASELTPKDLVQRFAEEHNVSFMPKFGRFHDGLQVSTGGK